MVGNAVVPEVPMDQTVTVPFRHPPGSTCKGDTYVVCHTVLQESLSLSIKGNFRFLLNTEKPQPPTRTTEEAGIHC